MQIWMTRVLVTGAVIASGIGAGYYFNRPVVPDADRIMSALSPCVSETNARPTCLRPVVKKLLERFSPAEIMAFSTAARSPREVTSQCHQIAHALGEETFRRSGALEPALASCTNACSFGCVHGAIAAQVADSFGEAYLGEAVAHADRAEIEATGKTYCDESGALCHGIGHIARIASETLSQALSTCDTVAREDRRDPCYRGVFMEDVGLVSFVRSPRNPGTDPDYGYPCTGIEQRYARACFMQLGDYQRESFRAEAVTDDERLSIPVSVCEKLTGVHRYECFYGVGYKLDRSLTRTGSVSRSGPGVCGRLKSSDERACVLGLAHNYASFAREADAVGLCTAQENPLRATCFDTAFRYMPMSDAAIERTCTVAESPFCTSEFVRYTATYGANARSSD